MYARGEVSRCSVVYSCYSPSWVLFGEMMLLYVGLGWGGMIPFENMTNYNY